MHMPAHASGGPSTQCQHTDPICQMQTWPHSQGMQQTPSVFGPSQSSEHRSFLVAGPNFHVVSWAHAAVHLDIQLQSHISAAVQKLQLVSAHYLASATPPLLYSLHQSFCF